MKVNAKWLCPTDHGLLLSTEDHPNGNMLRSTGEILITSSYNLSPWLRLQLYRGISDCAVKKGLYSRYPNSVENTQVDDLLGIGCDPLTAMFILDYARSHLGFYDVGGPETSLLDKLRRLGKQWIFRYQGLWQHLKMSAGENLGLLGRLIWAASIFVAARKPITDQDNWVLSHMMILVKERRVFRSWLCSRAVRYWRSKKTKPTHQIMAEYIGNPEHPLVEAWKEHG